MTTRRTPARKRKALSRERILASATRIVRRRGAHALSMRAVASDLGVSAPALYRHFRTREDMVGEIVRSLVADIEVEDPGGAWTDRARAHGRAIRRGVFARPELLELLRDGSAATAELAPLGLHFLLILREAGFEDERCVRNTRLLNWQVWSFILHEARLGWSLVDEDAREQQHVYDFPLSALPHAELSRIPVQLLPHLTRIDADELFELAFDAVLDRLDSERPPTGTNKEDPS